MQNQSLTDKQEKFCREYVIDLNATQAAIRAGYSEKTAGQIGFENLKKPEIENYINELQNDLCKATGVTAIRNILELKKIAYTSAADFKNDWFTIEDFNNLDNDIKSAISEISTSEVILGKGDDGGIKKDIKFKLHDKQRAIEILNKMLGFNSPDKVENTNNSTIEHKGISPIQFVSTQNDKDK